MILTINKREYVKCYYNRDKLIDLLEGLQYRYRYIKVMNPNLCLINQQIILKERNILKEVMMHCKLSKTSKAVKTSFQPRCWITNIIKLEEEEDENDIGKNKINMIANHYNYSHNSDINMLLLDNNSSIDSIEGFTSKLSYEYDKMSKRKQHCRNNSESISNQNHRLNYQNATKKLTHHISIEKINNNHHPKISLANPKIMKIPSYIIEKSAKENKPKQLFSSTKSFINNLREKDNKQKELQNLYKEMINSIRFLRPSIKYNYKSMNFPSITHKIPKYIPSNKKEVKAVSIKDKAVSSVNYIKHKQLSMHSIRVYIEKQQNQMNKHKSMPYIKRL